MQFHGLRRRILLNDRPGLRMTVRSQV